MNTEVLSLASKRISGPHHSGDLTVYLVHGPDRCDSHRFETLADALSRKVVVVHETGLVSRLEIENLSREKDLLVLAGEIVKGGRQDRTLGVDLVVPAGSRLPIPAYCVEYRRWAPRCGEDVARFSGSDFMLTKEALMQAKLSKSQRGVWSSISNSHGKLSKYLEGDVASPVSPSSYQLMMEHPRMRARVSEVRERFSHLLSDNPDAVGFVFLTHGQISSADVFACSQLARNYFEKHLEAALVDTANQAKDSSDSSPIDEAIRPEVIAAWLEAAIAGELVEQRHIAPRIRLEVRRSTGHRATYFGSLDDQLGVLLHENWIFRTAVDIENTDDSRAARILSKRLHQTNLL